MRIGESFNPFGLFVGSFVPNCLMRTTLLGSTEKLVWARLAQYAGKGGRAFPLQETLADEVGITPQGLRSALKRLRQHDLIKIHGPRGVGRLSHRPNEYVFLWHPLFEEEVATDSSSGEQQTPPPDSHSGSGPDSHSGSGPIEEDQIEEDCTLRVQGTRGAKWSVPDFRRHFAYQWRRRYDRPYPTTLGKDLAHSKYIVDYCEGDPKRLKRLLTTFFGTDFHEKRGHTVAELRTHLPSLLVQMAEKEKADVKPSPLCREVIKRMHGSGMHGAKEGELEYALQSARQWYTKVVKGLEELIAKARIHRKKQHARTGRHVVSDKDARQGTLDILQMLPRTFDSIYAGWIERQVSEWQGWAGSFRHFVVGGRHWVRFLKGFWRNQEWQPNTVEWKVLNEA